MDSICKGIDHHHNKTALLLTSIAACWQQEMDPSRTTRRRFNHLRLNHIRTCVPAIHLSNPFRMGPQHHRQPDRQLRTKSPRWTRSAKLRRRLPIPRHLDARQRHCRLQTPSRTVLDRRRRQHRRHQHPNATSHKLGPSIPKPHRRHDQLPRQHLRLPERPRSQRKHELRDAGPTHDCRMGSREHRCFRRRP